MRKYLLTYSVLVVMALSVMTALLCSMPQTDLHLWLNSYHTPFLDGFFRYYTCLAEWPFYVLAIVLLFIRQTRPSAVFYIFNECFSAAAVLTLKDIFCMPRPAVVFADQHLPLPVVDGVELFESNSFPSGHSATFFVFATVSVLLLALHWAQHEPTTRSRQLLRYLCVLILFLGAFLGAYSRIYLSQHFLLDVFVGSVIGYVVPILVFAFFRKFPPPCFPQKPL